MRSKMTVEKVVTFILVSKYRDRHGVIHKSNKKYNSAHGAAGAWALSKANEWHNRQYEKGIYVSYEQTRDREAKLYSKAYPILRRWLNSEVA